MLSAVEFEFLNACRLDLIDKKYGYGDYKGRGGLSEAEQRELSELQHECFHYATAPASAAEPASDESVPTLPRLSRLQRIQLFPEED